VSESDLAIAQLQAARDLTLKAIDRMGIPPDVFKRHDPTAAGQFIAAIYREVFRAVASPDSA
jgi:hypothetical protein